MLDITTIRTHLDLLKRTAQLKRATCDFDAIITLDDQRKALQQHIDDKKHAQKQAGKNRDIDTAKALKDEIKTLETQHDEIKKQLDTHLLTVPNFVHSSVPEGMSEDENVESKVWGKVPSFDHEVRDHLELMEMHDMLDVERAVKLSGSRFYFLKNNAVLLQQAVLRFAMDEILNADQWFVAMDPPYLVRPEVLTSTGFYPDPDGNVYELGNDELCLIGTSEIPLVSYYSGEILEEHQFPIAMVAQSPCFRREAGSYGKDVHGLYRVHQFTKVEQVIVIPADEELTLERYHRILANSEQILQKLEMPYRVLDLCTGDLALGKFISCDLECWMPSRNSYGETHSASALTDFQARRLGIRYRTPTGELKYAHTLNNTALALPRFLIPLIENNQLPDGSIRIPTALQPYMNGVDILEPKK